MLRTRDTDAHTPEEKKKLLFFRLKLLAAVLLIAVIPNAVKARTHYLEYQALLSSASIREVAIEYLDDKDGETHWAFDEDPTHMAELNSLISQSRFDGLIPGLLEKRYSIQYHGAIYYEEGRVGLSLSPTELYLSLPTPSAFYLRIDNPELHAYILENYYS